MVVYWMCGRVTSNNEGEYDQVYRQTKQYHTMNDDGDMLVEIEDVSVQLAGKYSTGLMMATSHREKYR